MSPADDRAAVLRRRALFIGSTLAALGGCQKNSPPAEGAGGTIVRVPAGEPTVTEPDAGVLPTRGEGRPSRPGAPSLEIPTGLSEAGQSRYDALVRSMTRAYAMLDELEAELPSCAVARCEDQWQRTAAKLFQLHDSFRFSYSCPGSSEEAKAFELRQKEHTDYYQGRLRSLDELIAQRAGDGGRARLDELLEQESAANPRPCLSFACMDW